MLVGRSFPLIPRAVPKVKTRYRTIVTKLPVPESIPILETLRQYEPVSMSGQPLVVWDRAQDVQVFDRWGNVWLDWSSGMLVANAGHGHKQIADAICAQVHHGLLQNYCFPCERRAQLVEELARRAPEGLRKVFLVTTGAETIECAIKLARTYGQKHGGKRKNRIVTFVNAPHHGRHLPPELAGGEHTLKEWMLFQDPHIIQASFPDGYRNRDVSFQHFLKELHQQHVAPDEVAGVLMESYEAGSVSFAPTAFVQELRRWCNEHHILLIFDEVQAGFGRTGTFWGFEHYGVTPDLFCCGKGISSSLPVAAVIGRQQVIDVYPPGTMTSTHGGSSVPAAAALANLQVIEKEGLVENARRLGEVLHRQIRSIAAAFPHVIGAVNGRGLVAGLHIVRPGTHDPDGERAFDIVLRCVEKGLLLFSPVGYGAATIKLAPPLTSREDSILEGASVLEEAIGESLKPWASRR